MGMHGRWYCEKNEKETKARNVMVVATGGMAEQIAENSNH